MKKCIYILDTSAILSGKPLNFNENKIISSELIKNEIRPGGKDYKNFLYLLEQGLILVKPKIKSINEIKEISKRTGDISRLSKVDIEILAIGFEYDKNNSNVIILSDDYSIQNIASFLKIKYEIVSQKGITKRFKWIYRCQGCGKKFKDNIKICPICGAKTKTVISKKSDINR